MSDFLSFRARSTGFPWHLSLLTALFATACADAPSSNVTHDPRADTHVNPPPTGKSVAFEGPELLQASPGEQISIVVRVTPRGSHRVRFALVEKLGSPKDASLDRSEADTASDGTAAITLTAPTSPALFTLRASVDDASAETGISVSQQGFGSLLVQPLYVGKRAVTTWVASVHQGPTCRELATAPLTDGAIAVESATSLQIDGAPRGVPLAVTVRAGYFASGCAMIGELAPGRVNPVTVTVTDVPLDLGELQLSTTLGLTRAGSTFALALAPEVESFIGTLRGNAADDVQAVLNGMRGELATGALAATFDAARAANQWDTVARAALGNGSPSSVADSARAWLTGGLMSLNDGAELAGRVSVVSPQSATFELERVASLDAALAGFNRNNPLRVATRAPDTVLLSANVTAAGDGRWRFSPSKLLSALALNAARVSVPSAMSVPEALAARFGCAKLATSLTLHGSVAGAPFAGCSSACAESLCEEALASMWQRAQAGSTTKGTTGTLAVSAAGVATIDDRARPTALSGTWVGTLAAPGVFGAPVGGDLEANNAR